MEEKGPSKIVAKNRKAWHDYHILQRFEAGLSLLGTEVKAVRAGHIGLRDTYAAFDNGELYLFNLSIGAYRDQGYVVHEERRRRKLLLHRKEIDRLIGKQKEQSLALVPLRVYFVHGIAKVELGLGRGKREYEKRQSTLKRLAEREMERAAGRRR